MEYKYYKPYLKTSVTENNKTKEYITYMEPVTLPDEPCMLEVDLGQTINVGNFNSVRVNVSLRYPVRPTHKGLEDSFTQVYQWVHEHLDRIVDEVNEAYGIE